MAKRRRRAFGKIAERPKKKRGRYEASYPTPLEYCSRYETQPARQTRYFDTYDDADAWLYQEKRLIDLGAWSPVALRKADAKRRQEQAITFGEYAANWIETRRKPDGSPRTPDTINHDRGLLRKHLAPVFGDTPMDAVSVRQVNEWIDTTAETMRDTPNARYNAYVLLNSIFASAATDPIDDEGTTLIDRSPVVRSIARPPKKHKTVPVTDAQIWALHDLIRDRFKRPDIATGVVIGLYQGLRVGEVLALRRCDVFRETNQLSVSASLKDANVLDADQPRRLVRGNTKTQTSVRVNPIAPELREALYDYMDSHVAVDPEAPLFPAPRAGGFLGESSFNAVFRRACDMIPELQGCRFHDLRHNHVTRLSNVAGVAVASRDAGHASPRMTATYMDAVSPDMLASGYDRLATAANDRSVQSAASAAGVDDAIAARAETLALLPPETQAQVLKSLPPDVAAAVMVAMFNTKNE
ncbi:hypothetical protein AH67_02250 [Bifidobacterium pseudolongum PV8-2]|uniref:Tyr recombinase domain-containing protein n=1 Tax=Bifidobacterium pseudolongum PV8-2 TaxID=1447715 RepID=A0A0A7I9V0_9BIFI|nr:site-specific integrase [Bifidobacterium pseudolongum]AIZ17012.1 hypothetical protein AH67_02250 [Bifidobacterium pseudolongum PV8-2]